MYPSSSRIKHIPNHSNARPAVDHHSNAPHLRHQNTPQAGSTPAPPPIKRTTTITRQLPVTGAPVGSMGQFSSRGTVKSHKDAVVNPSFMSAKNSKLSARSVFLPPEVVNDTSVLYRRRMDTLHTQLKKEIGNYVASKSAADKFASDNARGLLNLDSQNDNVRHVAGSCARIQAMLTQLDEETQADNKETLNQLMAGGGSGGVGPGGVDPKSGTALGLGKPEPTRLDEPEDVLALRAFASDDTTLETTSVADYAADPPAAPLYSADCVTSCIEEVYQSTKKMLDSNELLGKLAKDTPQWWNSAIIVRRLKTHAIRTNYHARKARLWGDQCRSHLFVHSSVVNQVALDATKDLREMKVKQEEVDIRHHELTALRNTLDDERHSLQAEWEDLQAKAGSLDEEVQQAAKAALKMDIMEAQSKQLLAAASVNVDGGSSEVLLLSSSSVERLPPTVPATSSATNSIPPPPPTPEEVLRATRQQQKQQRVRDAAKVQHQKLNSAVTEDCELALLLTKLTIIPEYAEHAQDVLAALGASWGCDPMADNSMSPGTDEVEKM